MGRAGNYNRDVVRDIKQQLRDLGVAPSKERGQNFLVDSSVIDEIVGLGRLSGAEKVLEIGGGLGVLTAELAAVAADLTVVEIEPAFCNLLRERHPGLKVICEDIRRVDLSTIGGNLVVYGNLPYSLSTEIVFHLLNSGEYIDRAVLLLQKEFAARMAAAPGSRTYGALSVACHYRADVRLGPVVPAESFSPVPRVNSQVVTLRLLPEPRITAVDHFWLQRTVQACFFKRRKKLVNSIIASQMFSELDIYAVLQEAEIAPECRAEMLTIEEFGRIAAAFEAQLSSGE